MTNTSKPVPDTMPNYLKCPKCGDVWCLKHVPSLPSPDGAGEAVATPFAWTIPGDDQADCNGFIPTKISREGEFTKPLYATPPVRAGREAIARLLAERFPGTFEDQECDPVTHEWKHPDFTPNEQAYAIADAILSHQPPQSSSEGAAVASQERQT